MVTPNLHLGRVSQGKFPGGSDIKVRLRKKTGVSQAQNEMLKSEEPPQWSGSESWEV